MHISSDVDQQVVGHVSVVLLSSQDQSYLFWISVELGERVTATTDTREWVCWNALTSPWTYKRGVHHLIGYVKFKLCSSVSQNVICNFLYILLYSDNSANCNRC